MVTLPAAMQVTTPFWETVAIFSSELYHSMFPSASAGESFAESLRVEPIYPTLSSAFKVSDSGGMTGISSSGRMVISTLAVRVGSATEVTVMVAVPSLFAVRDPDLLTEK